MIVHQSFNSTGDYNCNAFSYTDKVWDYHFHKNYELIYVRKGSVRCTVNNTEYLLSAGQFGLCLAYDIHRYEPAVDTLYWVLVFSEDFVRFFAKLTAGKQADGFAFCCPEPVLSYLEQSMVDAPVVPILTMKSCLYAVCQAYLDSVTLVEREGKAAETAALITDYIKLHHTEGICLKTLATRLGYDYHYMSRFFRQMFNMTFTDFVNSYRLETAIALLEDPRKSITAIAYESGFQSLRSFNLFFKGQTGMTPSAYRKAFRK